MLFAIIVFFLEFYKSEHLRIFINLGVTFFGFVGKLDGHIVV